MEYSPNGRGIMAAMKYTPWFIATMEKAIKDSFSK